MALHDQGDARMPLSLGELLASQGMVLVPEEPLPKPNSTFQLNLISANGQTFRLLGNYYMELRV